MNRVTFIRESGTFFDEIKEKVSLYFSQTQTKSTGNYKVYVKSVILLLMAVGSYALMVSIGLPLWAWVASCVFLGISLAGIGFNTMHDGAHGSYSSKKWLNEIAGYSLNLMGGNVFIWKNKHNHNHHNFTNVEGLDDDLDIEPWIRTHVNQPKRWYHRYQHIYSLVFYGLTYLNWVFVEDFKKYFSKKIASTDLSKMNIWEHGIFWLSKGVFLTAFLLLPMILIGFWKAIIGYLIVAFVCGLILGVIFQLAHLTDEAAFPLPAGDSNRLEQSWALHQIATTVNFATGNRFLFWFTGGLNFQVVHHLFPKMSHIHYPVINRLIRETCREHAIKYTEYPTFWGCLRAHLSYLKQLGAAA